MPRTSSSFSPVLIDRIDLKGGLDLVTPTLNLPPGIARNALNFEASITGGYTRIVGYERYDGQTPPSSAGWQMIALSALGSLAAGSPITGQTSGTTATVVGTTQLGVSFNELVWHAGTLSGAFVLGEGFKINGVTDVGQTVTYADPILGGNIGVSSTAGISIGSVILGLTSGAQGTVGQINLTLPVDDGVGYTKASGSFLQGETIKSGATTIGFVDSTNVTVQDQQTQAIFTAAAADVYRAFINVVPGGGPIRGVLFLNGTVYAWRDNSAVGATVTNIYKASGASWVNVPYAYNLPFTAATGTQPVAGNTITGATSGATATLNVVVQQAGGTTWAAGTGYFLVTPISGTFQPGETLKVGGAAVATGGGAATHIQPLPGGNYVFYRFNFGWNGSTITKGYGCDSVNNGFEFDGTNYVPVLTGMAPDIPTFVTCHKGSIFFAYGPSVQFSGVESPYQWTLLTGAGQFTMPGNITNMLPLPGNQSTGALGIWSATDTFILYGANATNFTLVSFNVQTGAIYNTTRNMSDTYLFEMRGVMGLTTTLNYGNFDPNSVTMHIRPLIQQLRNATTCAVINREKSQYRTFFNNGYALYTTFLNSNFIGAMPMLFPDAVLCVDNGNYSSVGQAESTFFGSNSGYVFQLDSGTSFDGVAINAQLTLVFDSAQTHRMNKRYRRASLEITGQSYAPIQFGYLLGYNKGTISQPSSATYSAAFSPTNWDSFIWDNFTWDGTSLLPTEVQMVGTAENVAISLNCNTNYTASFTINTATVHYSQRRLLRGGN